MTVPSTGDMPVHHCPECGLDTPSLDPIDCPECGTRLGEQPRPKPPVELSVPVAYLRKMLRQVEAKNAPRIEKSEELTQRVRLLIADGLTG
jgi:hypothetical protein